MRNTTATIANTIQRVQLTTSTDLLPARRLVGFGYGREISGQQGEQQQLGGQGI